MKYIIFDLYTYLATSCLLVFFGQLKDYFSKFQQVSARFCKFLRDILANSNNVTNRPIPLSATAFAVLDSLHYCNRQRLHRAATGGGMVAAARHRFAHSAFQLYFRHLCAVRPPVAVQKRKKKPYSTSYVFATTLLPYTLHWKEVHCIAPSICCPLSPATTFTL